jgi:hypothetical protein
VGSDVLVGVSLGRGVIVGGSPVGVGRSIGAGVALVGSTGGVASCAVGLSVISSLDRCIGYMNFILMNELTIPFYENDKSCD